MRRLFVLLGCIAAVLVVALPAAANNKPTTGARLTWNTTTVFDADTPFYTENGWVCVLADRACMSTEISANATFELYVDGVLQPSSVDVDLDQDAGTIGKMRLTSFPSGLQAGAHTFHGVWIKGGVVTFELTRVITFS